LTGFGAGDDGVSLSMLRTIQPLGGPHVTFNTLEVIGEVPESVR